MPTHHDADKIKGESVMSSSKKKLKAIIFDMDGTIIDSNKVWDLATQKTLEEYGLRAFTDEFKKHLDSLSGVSLTHAVVRLKQLFNLQEEPEALAHSILSHSKKLFKEGVPFIEGFEAFHAIVRKHNIPSCIATNADDVSLAQLKKTLNLENFFQDKIFNISHVNYTPKPDPALFLYAADQLGALPSECVVFEDSIVGFTAAKAAGMTCIAVKNKHNQTLLHEVASAIEHYHEAPEKIHELFETIFSTF